jgi:farnesyl diphosphate synthase
MQPLMTEIAALAAEKFKQRLTSVAAEIEAELERLLADQVLPGEIARPPRLLAAMRHACLGGGKRLRPFLVVETAALFNVPRAHAVRVGAALECVHAYSLVHDDLPSMDNDTLRRGRPTVHVAFDEVTAILVGDALLTLAFDILAHESVHPDAIVRIELVRELARAAGVGGMVGGQMLDLAAEGRFGSEDPARTDVRMLQRMKTGALIRFACLAGVILGRRGELHRAALIHFGEAFGEAFQLADDLLDMEGDADAVGKTLRKDAAAGKATWITRLGVEGARQQLAQLVGDAQGALKPFGPEADILRAAARFAAERQG